MRSRALVAALVGVVLAACRVDPQKFDRVSRAGEALKHAAEAGVPLLRYRELLQLFAGEVAIVEERASGSREKTAARRYVDALRAYHDAATVWTAKIEARDSDDVPLSLLRDPGVLDRYTIKTSVLEGTRDVEVFSGDFAMQLIWDRASQALDAATAITEVR